MTTTTLAYTVLGNSDFTNESVDIIQLANGDLLALEYVQNSNTLPQTSLIEFLTPTATSISNVTAQMTSGALPSGIGSVPLLATLTVGNNGLPDIVIGDGGLDQSPWYGGNVRILAPNAGGQYVDETSQLSGLVTNYNHRVSTGTIDGQAAFVVAMIGGENGTLKGGIELEIANADGTFSNWTSHLPAAVQNTSGFISNSYGGSNYNYTYAAIGDFADSSGDIFLGSENALINPSVLLVNNGSGYFSEVTLNLSLPSIGDGKAVDRNGTPAEWVVVNALPTKFQGDGNEDLIVVYANTAAASYTGSDTTDPAYYLQFLQGNGKGGFTDVTAQHLPTQPKLLDSAGVAQWVVSVQQVEINGQNDLILYDGDATVLVNDGQDHYTPSADVLPSNLVATSWGSDNGVQGFYGYTSGYPDQWVFVPISQLSLAEGSGSLSSQLASQFYLYGTENGKSLQQTYDMTITVRIHEQIISGAVATMGVYVNGQEVGTASQTPTLGFTYNGNQYTSNQSFTFTVKGLAAISSLQCTTSIPNVGDTINIQDVAVNSVDLSASNSNMNAWGGTGNTTDTISATAWNSALTSDTIGSAADPITVTGGRGLSTAHVLGAHTQYTETGIGTGVVTLHESAGLGQNAVLTDLSYVQFQDGALLNTQTGGWGYASAVSEAASVVSLYLDALQAASASSTLKSITLTDGGTPNLVITAAQLSADATALNDISGSYTLTVSAGASATTITGPSGHATTVTFTGDASQYSVTAANGALTVSSGGVSDQLATNVAALQFADFTEIVAAPPGGANSVTTGNVTELYSAVLAREPDVAGLAFYQTFLAANPSTPLQQFALWFLSSSEYISAHSYTETTTGDQKFITDSYQNLLHRTPSASEAAFYETNVLAPAVANLTTGTQAYANAQLQAHALMLVYFSASSEFLSDVQITASNPASASHWLLLT